MNDLLHEPAMKKLAGVKIESLVKAFCALAEGADQSNAATADLKLGWRGDLEQVGARYVPELLLRVTEVK